MVLTWSGRGLGWSGRGVWWSSHGRGVVCREPFGTISLARVEPVRLGGGGGVGRVLAPVLIGEPA